MKRREFGERWSFIWLIIATIVVIGLIFAIVPEAEKEVIEVTIEEFEKVTVKLEERNSTEHVEELQIGLLINAEELDLLARLIRAEAGSDWCTDELQRAVGSVVLNRINDDRFPATMYEVIYQDGQYSTTWSGEINKPYTDRTYANAKYLLENGVTIPTDVVWQANFSQGTPYKKIQGVYFGR